MAEATTDKSFSQNPIHSKPGQSTMATTQMEYTHSTIRALLEANIMPEVDALWVDGRVWDCPICGTIDNTMTYRCMDCQKEKCTDCAKRFHFEVQPTEKKQRAGDGEALTCVTCFKNFAFPRETAPLSPLDCMQLVAALVQRKAEADKKEGKPGQLDARKFFEETMAAPQP